MKQKLSFFVVVMLFVLALALFATITLPPHLQHEKIAYKKQSGPSPFKGYAPFAQWYPWETNVSGELCPYVTLAYAGLEWREIEPEQGVYDFDYLEEKYHLESLKKDGMRIVLRILADYATPGQEKIIPDWLYEAMDGSGEWYEANGAGGFSPDYDHPVFLAAHEKLLQALAGHYGEDFIAYIELGTVGHFGEWNTAAGGQMPGEESMFEYDRQYREAFPHTPLLYRRPFKPSEEAPAGFYNDMLATAESTDMWLDWLLEGDDYTGSGPMPEFWNRGPVGGEFSFGDPYSPLDGENYGETLRQLQASHMTFIGPCTPVYPENEEQMQHALEILHEHLGCELTLNEVSFPEVFSRKKNLVELKFENRGVSPLFKELEVVFELLDEKGVPAARCEDAIDFSDLEPGEKAGWRLLFPVELLPEGRYQLAVSIRDPWTKLPYPLSNGTDEDGRVLISDVTYAVRYSPYTALRMKIQEYGERRGK